MTSHSTPPAVRSWPLNGKVMTPEPGMHYVRRAPLLRQVDSVMERRLTVLQAPAGFGKTTVLADVSRRKQDDGLVVAWVSLDGEDTPGLLGSYIALAFENAGLALGAPQECDAWSLPPTVQQVGRLARALEFHAAPCLLVLDEVDRLPPASLGLLDRLLRHAPDNLHLAVAFRSNPGLDVARHVLAGSGTVVGTERFRFSRAEIDRFFHGELSRRELRAVQERTAGWPVALMMYRNVRAGGEASSESDAERLASDFVGACLLRELSADVRGDLLDLAVFESIDAELVDEVLGSSDARLRVAKRPTLEGLLLPLDRQEARWRLHPLVKEHCADLLALEDPVRKRYLHARIARALQRRGHLTPAWWHASEAQDSRLLGELVEAAGLFRLWLREGMVRLLSADRLLTSDVTASFPRCALLRCIALHVTLRFDEARALYESVAQATDGFTRDRDGGDDGALKVCGVFARAVLASGRDPEMHDEVDALPAAGDDAGDLERRQVRHSLLCLSCFERASFEESRNHGMKAQALYSEDMRYGHVLADIYLGMGAMAQGRVAEASARYARARRVARRRFPSDPCLAVGVDAVTIELDLERNHEPSVPLRTLQSLVDPRGAWLDTYAVAVGVSAELMWMQHGRASVVRHVTEVLDRVRPLGLEDLSRHVSGLLALYLVEAERHDEAARVWREHALPREAPDLFDLRRQPWRTMEALSCARIRLLAAQGEHVAADTIAGELCATASRLGLTRALLRGLALSMAVAHQAGDAAGARARLVEFLRVAPDAGYVRPLVRQGGVSRVVLRELLEMDLDPNLRAVADSVLPQLGERRKFGSVFSPRERQVLLELRRGGRNREIAERLGISEAGVRHHLKNIYRKTGVKRRVDALGRARSLGEVL